MLWYQDQPTFSEEGIPDLTGYVVIVTGGNGEIGYETSLRLALRGARVYVASRSIERVSASIQKMQESSPDKHLDLHFLKLDMENLSSIKSSVNEFTSKEQRLDILVSGPYRLTGDGFESQFQVNYLGHFILTAELLPLLLDTASKSGTNDRVRIVNVASLAAFAGNPTTLRLDDVNLTNEKGWLELWRRYGHTKQANIRHAKALNDRYSSKGVTAYSLHPGLIRSSLQDQSSGFFMAAFRLAMYVVPTSTARQGALNSLYAASSPHAPGHAAGRFIVPVAKVEPRADVFLRDDEGNDALWEFSEGVWRRYNNKL